MNDDVRSRRASCPQQSEQPARAVDPKPAIQLCCRVLRAVGVGSLSAELLRRAKFDKPEATWPVWQALHDLLVVSSSIESAAAAPRSHVPGAQPAGIAPVVLLSEFAVDNAATMRAMWNWLNREYSGPSSDGKERCELPELVRDFVSFQLACKGYAAADAWAADSALAASVGPKELVVALGWLLATLDGFRRYREALASRFSDLEHMLPPYPQMASALPCPPAGVAAAEMAARRTSARVARCLQAPSSHGSRPNKQLLIDRTAQILAEQGRLLLTARELGALQSERVKLQHRLQLLYRRMHQIDDVKPTPRDYTPYELRLLVDPQLRQRHAKAQSEATTLLEELHACDSHVPTFWRWVQALLPPIAVGTGGLATDTVEPASRQELLDQLAQVDISTESPQPQPQPRDIDLQAGIAAATSAENALDRSLSARAVQIRSLTAAQALRAGGVEGVGSNISMEALSAADKAVRAALPDLSLLLKAAIAELQLGRTDCSPENSDADSPAEELAADGRAYRYRPSGLVRLADWSEDESLDSMHTTQRQRSRSNCIHADASGVQEEAGAILDGVSTVPAVTAVMEAARLTRRRFVPTVKPEKRAVASPYASATPSSTLTTAEFLAEAAPNESTGADSGAAGKASGAGNGNGNSRVAGMAKGRGKGKGRAHVTSNQQWELQRENARLQRLLPGSSFGAGGRVAAARAAAAERSAAVQADMAAKIAAAEAASAGCAQRVEVLRESHLAKLRAVWDDFLAARPDSGYAALE